MTNKVTVRSAWWQSRWVPIAVIVTMSLIAVLPQLITGSTIVGSDGIFHFNRIYDTAKQISTGRFSYWQTNYGFQQSGRIVNAMYGPYFAYLMGLLLVVLRSWYHFQLVTTFAVYLIGGYGMYHLARTAGAERWPGLTVTLIFMNTGWLPRWGMNQNMTGIGAALLPYALACGVTMIRQHAHPVHTVQLALIMSVLIQTHVLSSIFAVMALIPFWIIGIITTSQRGPMIRNTLIAVIITVLLTANVWGAMLLLFGTNQIAYPHAFNLVQNTLTLAVGTRTRTGIGLAPILALVLTYLLLLRQWRSTAPTNWAVTSIGTAFLWLTTRLCPWATIAHHVPVLAQVLQFPVRLTTLALPLLLCGLALSLSQAPAMLTHARARTTILVALTGCALLFVAAPNVTTIAHRSQQVRQSHVLRNFNGLLLVNSTPRALRDELSSRHPGAILTMAEKHSSDYLPVNGKQGRGVHSPGSLYKREVLFHHPYFVFTPLTGGRLQVRWRETHSRWQIIPVVTYHQTKLQLNGHPLHHDEYQSSRINTPKIWSRRGTSTLTVRFITPKWTQLLMWLAVISWIILTCVLVWYYIPPHRANN